MFRTRIRHRNLMLLAVCFMGLFMFSAFTPLDNPTTVFEMTPEMVKENHTPSAIDFSALWNRTYGGFNQDRFYDMVHCADGGYAFVGYTESYSSDADIWVARTDSSGNVLWMRDLVEPPGNDIGRGVFECENGDIVVVGSSHPAGSNQASINRLDSDGSVIWTNMIGDDAPDDIFYDVVESESGCLLAFGNTESWGAGNSDVLLVCFSPNGNVIWMRTYGGASDDSARSVVECSNGGYAILCETFSFGEGFCDFYLLRIDNDGNLMWETTYGGSDNDYPEEVVEYSGGGFVMVGSSESLGDPNGDFWAIRVDDSGSEIWNETYVGGGSDFATGIVESVRGGFAIVGVTDFISGVDQTRITRIDTDGTELWSNWYGGPDIDFSYGIVETYPEEFVVAGTTNSYGAGFFDGWVFLVPGKPRLIDPPDEVHIEFGHGAGANLWAESTAPIHMWWLKDTSVFNIVKIGDNEGSVYRLMPPDVGYYEIWVHVNNTAGHETEHIFFIYVDDTTAPYWQDFTAEHTLEFGDQFLYTPRAADLSFLGEWFLFGTSYFTIDTNTGDISSVGKPPVGEYNLEITVGDMYHNTLVDDIQIIVQDTTAPTWDIVIEDQSIDYGEDFVYDLAATDLAGISSWSVDNAEFSVDSEGRVRNLVTLAPGVHAVTVSVSDANDNILQGQFIVTVGDRPTTTQPTTTQPTTTPSGGGLIDSAILFGAGVGATLVIVAVVCVMGRRKPSSK